MAKVLVPLAQGCEELEAVTIVDLLRRAQIDVVTAGLDAGPVRGSQAFLYTQSFHSFSSLNRSSPSLSQSRRPIG